MEERECMGCKYDIVPTTENEFQELLDNCQNCYRAYINDSDERKNFKDNYLTT